MARNKEFESFKKMVMVGFGILLVLQILQFAYFSNMLSQVGKSSAIKLKEISLPTFDEYDPRIGGGDTILFIEFTDYECPFCARHATQTFPQIMAKYGDKMTYAIMDLPLTQIHPKAIPLAKLVNCTFKEYGGEAAFKLKDYIFSNRENWVDLSNEEAINYIKNYLAENNMNVDECANSTEVEREIQNDLVLAVRDYGFNGTPSFIIAMKGVTPDELEELKSTLDDYAFAGLRYRLVKAGDYVAVMTSGALPFQVFDNILKYAG